MKKAPQQINLINAIRTISRSAHAWRDRAAARYEAGKYRTATTAKRKKESCYDLKERGIVVAHKLGLVHYIGQSPQGMAVYQYGDHEYACFHSCLHPRGAERPIVEGQPEVLHVATKRTRDRICDAVHTLKALPSVWQTGAEYERSAAPRIARPPVACWECGEEGHIARDCPERLDGGLDEFDYLATVSLYDYSAGA